MTDHDELVATGVQAMHFLFVMPGTATNRDYAAAVIDAVEPLIRADERERAVAAYHAAGTMVREDERATLRAQIESLPVQWQALGEVWVKRGQVLALLDGSSE